MMKKNRIALFSVVFFLLAAVAAAVFVSFVFTNEKRSGSAETPGMYRPGTIEGLPHEHVPGAKGLIAGSTAKINSLGFRGPEIKNPKPGNLKRIVVLGDSVMFGQGVREAETLPARLAALLKSRAPGIEWEVVNAGVRAYESRHYRIVLTHRVFPLDPDLVVLVITEINDPQREPFVPRSEKIERWNRSWWAKLPFVRPFLAGAYAEEVSRVYVDYVKGLYAPDGKEWPLFYEDLWEIQRSCRERGVPIIAVTFPLLSDEDLFEKEREQLQKALDEMGVPRVDPRPRFAGYPAADLVVDERDFHPNGTALNITAQLLVEPAIRILSDK